VNSPRVVEGEAVEAWEEVRVQEVVCLRVLVVVGDDVLDLMVVVLPSVVLEEADEAEEEEEVEVEVREAEVVEAESLDSTLN
jgi:hypothetical protein